MFGNARGLWAVLLALSIVHFQEALAQESAAVPATPDFEVLTRGPVHEAFAQPFDLKPEPGPAVPKEPPPAVPEEPPEERPQGDNVRWIGGYWAWDADRNDFIWVSGTYRNAPPGRQFIPGHWVNTAEGWRWVAGFWAPENQSEIPYAEQPPAPLDTQPSLPPPDDNSTYVPGYWFYRDSTFIWRPGFYTAFRPGRIWIAPRYIWTPAGYIYGDGYWDYPLEDRGLLFAPVWFHRPLWRTAGWFYRPAFVVGANALLDSLFRRHHHYYFGNYYGPAYARLGFQPWFGRGYDPLFNYYRWTHRGNPNWAAGVQRTFNDRVAGRVPAPPVSLAQQKAGNRVVAPLSASSSKLTRSSAAQLAAQNASIRRANQLAQLRHQQESVRRNAGTSLKISPTARTTSSFYSSTGNKANFNGVTTRSTGQSQIRGIPELKGLEGRIQPHQGVVVRNGRPRDPWIGNVGRGQPRTITNSGGVPRVLNNSAGVPRVVNSTPRVITSTPRTTLPQTRSFTPSFRHVAPTASRAGRATNHAPARSGGGGHRRR
jgi:hypothetical protein